MMPPPTTELIANLPERTSVVCQVGKTKAGATRLRVCAMFGKERWGSYAIWVVLEKEWATEIVFGSTGGDA